MAEMLDIEIAWQAGDDVRVERCSLPAGSRVADALRLWGGDADPARVGVCGRTAALEQLLQPGDRVEIYSPLLKDPKAARRERAKRAQRR
jgi:putative ubiquitin-RnfH superfamily antitoxin RatB of RatAB toxin-antitoxin module